MTHFTCPSSNCYYTITTILGVHHLYTIFCRWRLVIHGSIDGYSRLIVYLRCSDNNWADTVLHLFVEAVQHYGCPSRVRGDRGGEDTLVADFMISERVVASFPCRPFPLPVLDHSNTVEPLLKDSPN